MDASTPPLIQHRTIRPGDWLGCFHCADVRDGVAIFVADPDGYFSKQELEAAGRAYRNAGVQQRKKQKSRRVVDESGLIGQ